MCNLCTFVARRAGDLHQEPSRKRPTVADAGDGCWRDLTSASAAAIRWAVIASASTVCNSSNRLRPSSTNCRSPSSGVRLARARCRSADTSSGGSRAGNLADDLFDDTPGIRGGSLSLAPLLGQQGLRLVRPALAPLGTFALGNERAVSDLELFAECPDSGF